MSLGDSRNTTCPPSPKIVGHGLSSEHGAGDVMLVMTSDDRLLLNFSGSLPRAPASESMTRNTGARDDRTTSPQDAAATAATAVRAIRLMMRIRVIASKPW